MIEGFQYKGLQRFFEAGTLKGDLKGHWAMTVYGHWRMVFAFEGTDAVLVDYRDYH